MNKNFILFFQFCFTSLFLLGSDVDFRKIKIKHNLDRAFKSFGLAEYNEITRMSQKIVEKERNEDELEVLVFLSCRSYKEYLTGQSVLLGKQHNLSFQEIRNNTQAALEEFESKKKDILEILKAQDNIRSSSVDTQANNNEFEKLLPSGLLEDEDYK